MRVGTEVEMAAIEIFNLFEEISYGLTVEEIEFYLKRPRNEILLSLDWLSCGGYITKYQYDDAILAMPSKYTKPQSLVACESTYYGGEL